MQYQSFPDAKGGSRSLDKLKALRLPPLKGKRFLDVGCNEGFFCGYALFDGASRVVGMDNSATAIGKAALRFPEAVFLNQSWQALPDGPFDVITLLSALHYAEDQAGLIHSLMAILADDGLLILEIGMAPGTEDAWVSIRRDIDERYFPTRKKLGNELQDYAWKIIGHSVNQVGDPLPRYVVHVRKLKPYAWLLMREPGSGKSTIGRRMFGGKPGIPVISGDQAYLQVFEGQHQVSDKLRALVNEEFTTASIDRLTRHLMEQGLAGEMVALWVSLAGFREFVLDSYVPETYRPQVKDALHSQGYYPMELCWDNEPITDAQLACEKANGYQLYLKEVIGDRPAECVRITRQLGNDLKPWVRWHLDSPTEGEWLINTGTFRVAGWLVTANQLEDVFEIYVSGRQGDRQFKPEQVRIDVLRALFGRETHAPLFWQLHPCGFSFELPAHWLETGFELGMVSANRHMPLAFIANTQRIPHKTEHLGLRLARRLLRYCGKRPD
ncbi:class I SAM-dependent methyltransferase [Zobellella maritima]|uniref:class I SAM-dependent methyltransferase n=1 Tax=Zobellella maritima TaxID=2059725 RepID=UPI001300B12D|nr:class I SAM-dependent methyltransferase [Zobellella maritima]